MNRFRPPHCLEELESRMLLTGIANGGFELSDPLESGFGWESSASFHVEQQRAQIDEHAIVQSALRQTLSLPVGTAELEFVIHQLALGRTAGQPPDAIEIALLDAATLEPLVPAAVNLPGADAFLNIDADGHVHYGAQTAVPGAGASGDVASLAFPVTIRTSLAGIAPGTNALVVVDLIGFGAVDSSATLDDFRLTGDLPPYLSLAIDPATDSGRVGDAYTNFTTVHLVGQSEPGQQVLLDIDGDGFDDGTTAADTGGDFRFDGFVPAGPVTYRVQATNAHGTSTAERSVLVDVDAPTGALASPTAGATLLAEPHFVEVRWRDLGPAGADPASFDPADVSISGVDIDRVEVIDGHRVRYHYADDGDTLPYGPVQVTLNTAAVVDRAGNPSTAVTQSFQLVQTGCAWHNTNEPVDTNANGHTTPLDALIVINELNFRAATGQSGVLGPPPTTGEPFFLLDVNCDGFITPRDALWIINHLNA